MKFKSYVTFFLLFGVLSDLVICLLYGPESSLIVKSLICLPTLASLVALVLIGLGIRYTDSLRVFSYLIFLFELPKFVFSLFSALGPVAAIPGGAVSLFFAYLIFYSTRHLRVNELELSFEGLPGAFDGLRVCQMGDLHLGSFGRNSSYVKKVLDKAAELSPDIFLFVGDLVNFDSREADSYLEGLGKLKAPLGVYAIRGNHDYLLHGHHNDEEREKDMERLLGLERSLGWRVLLNGSAVIEKDGDKIAVAGVENVSSNPYFTRTGGDLKKALEGIPEGTFTILLTHDPSHWGSEVVPSSGVPLTLSGHTHGLKYKLAGLNTAHWRLPFPSGVFTREGQVLHVTKGLGSAFAFRLGGFPCIDIITLRRKNAIFER